MKNFLAFQHLLNNQSVAPTDPVLGSSMTALSAETLSFSSAPYSQLCHTWPFPSFVSPLPLPTRTHTAHVASEIATVSCLWLGPLAAASSLLYSPEEGIPAWWSLLGN